MKFENLLLLFDDLLSTIRSKVEECKCQHNFEPEVRLFTRWKVEAVNETETGPRPSCAHLENIERQDWLRAGLWTSEQLRTVRPYLNFLTALGQLVGKDVREEVDQALCVLVANAFENQASDSRELLESLLTAIKGQAVTAWSDIDVWGITLRTKLIDLCGAKCRMVLRQLDIPDFEEESAYGLPAPTDRSSHMPDSILRLEMKTTSNADLQRETRKALVLLRLVHVCSVDFGRRAYGASSPFRFIGRTSIGGTSYPHQVRGGRHRVSFTDNSRENLQRFWEQVEPKLPTEVGELGGTKTTHLSIAYERYCDALFACGRIEQEIAAAVMGLEAIYFRRDEMQELAYRLSLRVSKVLSKLGMESREIQTQIKIGYRIRSMYVHGSHASDRDWKDIQKAGMSPAEFGTKLLNYLRISILHLICSQQEKSQFLDLVEDSFICRERDDALREILEAESSILKI